jgi:hypothetical protein
MDTELVKETLQEMQDEYWTQFDELRAQLRGNEEETEDEPSLDGLRQSIEVMAQVYDLAIKLRVLHYLKKEQN